MPRLSNIPVVFTPKEGDYADEYVCFSCAVQLAEFRIIPIVEEDEEYLGCCSRCNALLY